MIKFIKLHRLSDYNNLKKNRNLRNIILKINKKKMKLKINIITKINYRENNQT